MPLLTLPASFLELDGDDLRLYLFLLRQGGYKRSTYDLSDEIHMTRQRLRTCLSHLTQKGLINPKPTQSDSRNSAIINVLMSASNSCLTQNQPKQEKETEAKEKLPPAPPIKEKEDKEKEGASLCAYVNPSTRQAWTEWLRYKQQMHDGYTTPMGAQRAYSHAFRTLAGCDAGLFADIVAQSIRHEWRGLFPLHASDKDHRRENSSEIGIRVYNTQEKDYIGW